MGELPLELDVDDPLTGGFIEARVDRLLEVAERIDEQVYLPTFGRSSDWYLSRIAHSLGIQRRHAENDHWLRQRVLRIVFGRHQGTRLGVEEALADLLVKQAIIVEWIRDHLFLDAERSFLGGPKNWLCSRATMGLSFRVRVRPPMLCLKQYAPYIHRTKTYISPTHTKQAFLGECYLFDDERADYSTPLWLIWWLVDRLRMAGTTFEMEIL
ncbi:MAG: hypothetical protein GF399_03905 [Candidatus Coatesbacteria bacterium]|nr:hypothetical protein [Candidatus Coatesbacteria bacterium]